jgi:hypothetical protein
MRASKETAKQAKQQLKVIAGHFVPCSDTQAETLRFLEQFIDAAERKLPSEAAYKRDRTRVR